MQELRRLGGRGMEAALGFNYRNKWSEGEERTELAEGPADLAASHVRPYGDGGGGGGWK